MIFHRRPFYFFAVFCVFVYFAKTWFPALLAIMVRNFHAYERISFRLKWCHISLNRKLYQTMSMIQILAAFLQKLVGFVASVKFWSSDLVNSQLRAPHVRCCSYRRLCATSAGSGCWAAYQSHEREGLVRLPLIGLPPLTGFCFNTGNTLLMLAAYAGHTELTKSLISRGADPNRLNDLGQSMVAGAVFKAHDDIVHALVSAGANPRLGTPNAIQTAHMFGRKDLMEVFGAKESDIGTEVPTPPGSLPPQRA
jgi:hypothetical protein